MKNIYAKTIEEAYTLWEKRDIGKAQDFTNQKINKWTILYRTVDPRRPMWVGQCECGNIGKLRAGSWSQQCKECQNKNKQKDYKGLRFNKLVVLDEREQRKGKTYLKCRCDCGNETWVSNGSLTSGEVKSCGCLSHQCNKELEDLTGKTYNDLTIINLAFKKDGYRYWHCKCKCGNEKDIKTSDLTTNKVKSCGCRKYLQINPGDKFGKLTVISKITDYYAPNGGFLYECSCDCGTKSHIVRGSNLVNGSIKSCGCGRNISYQEENISNLLKQLKLPFIREYKDIKLNELYSTHGRPMEYDFFVNDSYIIEYDGSQHFYCKESGWDTKEHLKRTRKNDLIKNKYCFENNIPLIRIPYDADYTINDLKLETTRFLLTPENEEEYYKTRIKE